MPLYTYIIPAVTNRFGNDATRCRKVPGLPREEGIGRLFDTYDASTQQKVDSLDGREADDRCEMIS